MIINGNNLEELKNFPDNYFHSVVTDPPYGLSFMGKKWDYDVPSVELWTDVFRVLKEGGYLLSFAGTRTQHRMAVNIEDAGFEIRDMIAWVYGSGFPKSHNIGKAVDKLQGNERDIVGKNRVGRKTDGGFNKNFGADTDITEGTSEWEGWGTALKPALEPITMARKPFKTTVAENVLKNGVGGINIDGCRVETEDNLQAVVKGIRSESWRSMEGRNDIEKEKKLYGTPKGKGRFPANIIHDGSDEVKDLFPDSKVSGAAKKGATTTKSINSHFGNSDGQIQYNFINDKGSASRFFYCAKASKQDRNEGLEDFEEKRKGGYGYDKGYMNKGEGMFKDRQTMKKNTHPTVKPTDLMRYLIRLVTPKGGVVLDCFMGSGSTGKACALEGFNFVGIDLDKDYCKIAKARIDKAIEDKKQADSQVELF